MKKVTNINEKNTHSLKNLRNHALKRSKNALISHILLYIVLIYALFKFVHVNTVQTSLSFQISSGCNHIFQ